MYQQILDTLPYPCSFVSTDYTYIAVNKIYSEFYSVEVHDIIGKKLPDLLGDDFFVTEVKPMVDKAFSGSIVKYEIEVEFNKNCPKTMKMTYTPYKDENGNIIGMVSHGEDITVQKKLEKELRFNESYFNSIFTKNPHVSIVTNGNEIVQGNQQMLDFVGYQSLTDFKKDYYCICSMFLKGESLLQAQMGEDSWLDYILKNKHQNHYVQMKKDGKTHEFIVTANPINLDENKRSIVSFSDITELKHMEKLLHEQEELLIAQSRHAAMGEMISMIAHQWRQPISVISMLANNLRIDVEFDEVSNEKLNEYSKMINEHTEELSNTIDDFSDFFKPVKEKELTTINEIYITTYAVIGKSLENNGIKLVKNCNTGYKFYTYKRELMQVLINILKNAKEALLERKINNPIIQCDMEEDIQTLSIQISDNGGGISQDILNRVFDPYFTTKGVASGTGLGLYISKIIIEEHMKGTISVHNTKEGASFNISIPV